MPYIVIKSWRIFTSISQCSKMPINKGIQRAHKINFKLFSKVSAFGLKVGNFAQKFLRLCANLFHFDSCIKLICAYSLRCRFKMTAQRQLNESLKPLPSKAFRDVKIYLKYILRNVLT